MRDALMDSLTELASANPNVMLLTADLGFGVFEEFSERFPKQYLNVGVAEQNMVGVASGLALEGKTVFTYSIGNFPTLRCLEQIRNDICYHELNVNIIASGGGFSYGGLGMSHHATEDLSILRALPEMTVVAPCTAWETGQAVLQLAEQSQPGYLRIDKTKANDNVQPKNFELGKSRLLRDGDDFTLIVAGGIAHEVLMAAKVLEGDGVNCRVVSMHTVKPIDREVIIKACEETGGIASIEENNIIGGLGSAVSDVCMENMIYPKAFIKFGLKDHYVSTVGSQKYLRKSLGISEADIVRYVLKVVG